MEHDVVDEERTTVSATVYTLKLADDCFYVGRVKNNDSLVSRILQHEAGEGAEWTKLHPVLDTYSVRHHATNMDEDACVISLMAEHGIDKVRGGTFCTPELTAEEIKFLTKMVDTYHGACYQCHETGHCTNECPISHSLAMNRGGDWWCPDCNNLVFASKDTCRCGKWKPKEFKKATLTAGWKPGDWECPKCKDHVFAKNTACRKCHTPKSVTVADPVPVSLKRPRQEEDEKKEGGEEVAVEEEPVFKKPRLDEQDMKSGDWICSCQVHNYASRKVCYKCKKVRPLKDAEQVGTCCICMDKQVRVAAQPCGHLAYCETCVHTIGDVCSICKEPITNKQTMYQS